MAAQTISLPHTGIWRVVSKISTISILIFTSLSHLGLGQIPWCGREMVSATLWTVVAFNCTCIKHIITLVFPSSDLQDQFTVIVQSSPHFLGLPSELFWTIFFMYVLSKRFRETQEATVKHSKRTVKITDGSSNNWRAGEETTSAVNCSGTKQTLILSQTHSHGLHTSFLSWLNPNFIMV